MKRGCELAINNLAKMSVTGVLIRAMTREWQGKGLTGMDGGERSEEKCECAEQLSQEYLLCRGAGKWCSRKLG